MFNTQGQYFKKTYKIETFADTKDELSENNFEQSIAKYISHVIIPLRIKCIDENYKLKKNATKNLKKVIDNLDFFSKLIYNLNLKSNSNKTYGQQLESILLFKSLPKTNILSLLKELADTKELNKIHEIKITNESINIISNQNNVTNMDSRIKILKDFFTVNNKIKPVDDENKCKSIATNICYFLKKYNINLKELVQLSMVLFQVTNISEAFLKYFFNVDKWSSLFTKIDNMDLGKETFDAKKEAISKIVKIILYSVEYLYSKDDQQTFKYVPCLEKSELKELLMPVIKSEDRKLNNLKTSLESILIFSIKKRKDKK